MRSTILMAALLAAGAARAQEADHVSGEGDGYALAPVEGGVTLTSASPVLRFVGSASLGGPDVLLLRADCTAEADGEAGTWGQANGGFLVDLPGRDVGFPRQELLIDADCPLE